MKFKQEKFYLTMVLLLVSFSYNFIRINLLSDSSFIEIDEFFENNALLTIMSSIYSHSKRLDKNIRLSEEVHDNHFFKFEGYVIKKFIIILY